MVDTSEAAEGSSGAGAGDDGIEDGDTEDADPGDPVSGDDRRDGPSTSRRVGGTLVRGVGVESETRCAHYAGDRDVVAVRFACCDAYYPCFECHEAVADHPADPIPAAAFDEAGVLCGACGAALTVREYLDCGFSCPDCGAAFNPGCAAHYDRYFETE